MHARDPRNDSRRMGDEACLCWSWDDCHAAALVVCLYWSWIHRLWEGDLVSEGYYWVRGGCYHHRWWVWVEYGNRDLLGRVKQWLLLGCETWCEGGMLMNLLVRLCILLVLLRDTLLQWGRGSLLSVEIWWWICRVRGWCRVIGADR
jgi:hypothetical protein